MIRRLGRPVTQAMHRALSTRRVALILIVGALAFGITASAAVGDDASQSVETAAAAKAKPTIKVRKGRFGRYLTDGRGLTLYLFTRDKGKPKSTCYGACEKAWPVLAGAKPIAGNGVKASYIGTTRRKDGRVQATYRGHPLYYYEHEDQAGEILCQDVAEFGGTWLIVAPSGKAIR